MPIVINGSGTVTGISAGGLPDDCITTADIAANAVTTAKLGSAEASGLCKAWVNFNGSGVVAIRASYNVSSITDNGTGDYTVNFTTALADANYAVAGHCGSPGALVGVLHAPVTSAGNKTASSLRISTYSLPSGAKFDATFVDITIFR
jgi:hypothetical protein